MVAVAQKLTKRQKELILDLGSVGEALKHWPCFEGGGYVLSYIDIMERLEAMGIVKIDTVGQSVFATLSAKGQELQKQLS